MPSYKECDSKQFNNIENGVWTADKKYGPVITWAIFTQYLQQIPMDRPWGWAAGYLDDSMQNCSNSSALAVLRSAVDRFCV